MSRWEVFGKPQGFFRMLLPLVSRDGVWAALKGHLARFGGCWGISGNTSGILEAGLQAVWVALGDGLGSYGVSYSGLRGLGNPRNVSKAFGGGLGLFPERPGCTLLTFFAYQTRCPENYRNSIK